MQRMKKWFGNRKLGSSENLDSKPSSGSRQLPANECQYELTSVRIKQLLEKNKFQKIVDSLREFPHDYLLHCLQSFPFKALNRAIPDSFAIWETLLTKLHNSEEGYIPLFPYAACDELVLEIAWLLETCRDDSQPSTQELVQSCKRVLKKVFMQYNEVLENLYKEQEKVQHALYTLRLHLPLGSNLQMAPTLHQAITEEVKACLGDYTDVIDRLEDLSLNHVVSLTEVLQEQVDTDDETNEASPPVDSPLAPAKPSQLQVQERLYHNQCVLTTLQPSRRHENLPQLLEILNERICGDKEVLAIFAGIRQKNESICSDEPLGPWLRRYQHAVECAIMALKDIEKELEITISNADSPVQLKFKTPPDSEELTLPDGRQRSISLESDRSFSSYRRHSAAIIDNYLWEEGRPNTQSVLLPNRLTPTTQSHRRPRSTSPHKTFRIGTGSDSCKSVDSTNGGSNSSLVAQDTCASVHDLDATREGQAPMLAFTRVQSLKTNQSVSVVAGKRKKKYSFNFLPNSLTNLSTSAGNVSSKKSRKSLSRSGSGELVVPWDGRNGDMSANQFMLQQELEYRNKELFTAREVNQDLKKKVRELTDRLSDQAQRQLQDSEKFEDILLGNSRPTVVVQRYQELYSQGRVEALEAIASALGREEEEEEEELSPTSFSAKLLLDVLKFAYSSASASLGQLNGSWRRVLGVHQESSSSSSNGAGPAVKQLESAVGLYLRRVCAKHDTTAIEQDVKQKLLQKYSDHSPYAKVCELEPFLGYLKECARLAWDLCVQTPPMTINFSLTEFIPDMHWRFFDSDKSSDKILAYLWPTLLQDSSGVILFRGCVLT